MNPNQNPRFVRKFNCYSFYSNLLVVVSTVPVEGRDTHMRERQTDRDSKREKEEERETERPS